MVQWLSYEATNEGMVPATVTDKTLVSLCLVSKGRCVLSTSGMVRKCLLTKVVSGTGDEMAE